MKRSPEQLRRDREKARDWQRRSAKKAEENRRARARQRAHNGDGRTTPARRSAPLKRAPIKPVSKKRQAEQRERVKMLQAETAGVPVACERCDAAEANDAHEIVPRSAGGSITDRSNIRFICRPCHRWIGDNPAEAEREGWLISRYR